MVWSGSPLARLSWQTKTKADWLARLQPGMLELSGPIAINAKTGTADSHNARVRQTLSESQPS